MSEHGITDNVELRLVGALVAAASNTDNNSDIIDMQDYEAVAFFTNITASVATGVATLTLEQNDANSDSGMAAISGSAAALTCAVNNDINGKQLVAEIRNPSKRFVQAVRTSATANITFGPIYALLTPRRTPVVQHSSIGARKALSN